MLKRKKSIFSPAMWKNTESCAWLLRPVTHDNGSGLTGNNESLWGSGCGNGQVLEDINGDYENGSGEGRGIAYDSGLLNGAGSPEICSEVIFPENESTN